MTHDLLDLLFRAITWPCILIPLGIALAGVLFPARGRAPLDYGRGAFLLACLLIAALWGAAVYANAWAFFLIVTPLPLLAVAGAVTVFAVAWAYGKGMQALMRRRSGEDHESEAARGHFLGAILIVVLSVVLALPAAAAGDAPGAYAVVARTAWLAVSFVAFLAWLYARKPTRGDWKLKPVGYVAFAGLFTLLTAAPGWRAEIALVDTMNEAMPATFERESEVDVSVYIADNCDRQARATWHAVGSVEEVATLLDRRLRAQGWTGGWKGDVAFFHKGGPASKIRIETRRLTDTRGGSYNVTVISSDEEEGCTDWPLEDELSFSPVLSSH